MTGKIEKIEEIETKDEYRIGDLVHHLDTNRVDAIINRYDGYTFDDRPRQTWYGLFEGNGLVLGSTLRRATSEESRHWVWKSIDGNYEERRRVED